MIEELYATYREDVFRLVYMLTGSRVISESVTQDVFRAAARQDGQRPAAAENPQTRLLAAARRITLGRFKKEGRPVPLEGKLPYRDANDLDFLDVLHPLTPVQREAFLCCFLYDLPHAETAKIMGLPQAAVRKAYDRAEEILRFVERKKEEFP